MKTVSSYVEWKVGPIFFPRCLSRLDFIFLAITIIFYYLLLYKTYWLSQEYSNLISWVELLLKAHRCSGHSTHIILSHAPSHRGLKLKELAKGPSPCHISGRERFEPDSYWGSFPCGLVVKNLPANARDAGLIPGLGRCPGGGSGNSLQYPCLGNPVDKGSWWATAHGVTKSRTQLNDWNNNSLLTCFFNSENERKFYSPYFRLHVEFIHLSGFSEATLYYR